MSNDEQADVPYGEDFHDPAVAAAWADSATRKRPFRAIIFDHFASAINKAARAPGARVLELGSGPGMLAERMLEACPAIVHYTLLDFSEPMLDLSRRRLERHAARTRFVRADFKDEAWPALTQGPFDFILSHQAVHELRHKRHAPRLYAQVRSLLAPGGEVLICDHLPEGAHTERHRVLYMSPPENREAFAAAGFSRIEMLWSGHSMALHRARV